MKHSVTLMLLTGVLQGMPAAAAPCVGAAYDLPLAGAVDVVMRYADVPSAQFPGIWQEGRIGGNFYQIFSNRVAILRADRLSQEWSVTVDCQQRPCLQTVTGIPPDAVKAVSGQLEQCLVPPEVKVAAAPAKPKPAPELPKSKPQSAAIEAPDEAKPKDPVKVADPKPAAPKVNALAAQPAPATKRSTVVATAKGGTGANLTGVNAAGPATQGLPTNAGTGSPEGVGSGTAANVACVPVPEQNIALRPLTCGLSLMPPGTPGATLQRLLVLAGANPGLVDGSYGRKTKDAVVQVLGFAGRDLDLQQSISAVDAYLCRQGQPQP